MTWKWADKKIIDFLDVALDLNNDKHKTYKPNKTPQYVHKDWNHPPCFIKNIPINVKKGLSKFSLGHHIFEQAKSVYQEALNKSGYNHQLSYTPPTEITKHQSGKR